MKDIILQHESDIEQYREAMAKIATEREKIEAQIERANKKLAKLDKKEEKLHKPSRYTFIELLADKLSKHFGLHYKLYGPFGIECETSIYLFKNPKLSICEQDTLSITLRPFGDVEKDWLTYDTGERLDRYPKGSIGDLNGMNAVYKPLPKEFNQIVELMSECKKEEG